MSVRFVTMKVQKHGELDPTQETPKQSSPVAYRSTQACWQAAKVTVAWVTEVHGELAVRNVLPHVPRHWHAAVFVTVTLALVAGQPFAAASVH